MAKKVDAILSPNFVEEMLRLAFANKQFAELVVDNLDLSNFPRELGGCKAMLKEPHWTGIPILPSTVSMK